MQVRAPTSGGRVHARQLRGSTRCSMAVRAHMAAARAVPVDPASVTRVKLIARTNCALAVSRYPMFAYNAGGGGGWATASDAGGGSLRVVFDPAALPIPALNWRTGSMFNVPIPPPFNIEIVPQRLEGVIDTLSGRVELEFDARFMFTAGWLYAAPPLLVHTLLTTETSRATFREATGSRIANGQAKLVGTATVARTGDGLIDTFLMLPSDALAIMAADFVFDTTPAP